jgi:replicative DNA helicase
MNSSINWNIASEFLMQEVRLLEPIIWWVLSSEDYDLNKLSVSLDDIRDSKCKSLLSAVIKTNEEGFGRDIVQIVNKFTSDGYEQSYVTHILNNYFSTINIDNYVKKYKEFLGKRDVLKIGNELMIKACSNSLSSWDIMKYANNLLETISSSANTSYDIGDNINNLYDYLEERKWKELFGYSFGGEFQFLDKATRWIQQWRTYRVGALSNMGKTQWVYGVINNLISQWAKVAFFSLENDKDMTMSNLLANRQRINSWDLESGKVDVDFQAIEEMQGNLFIIDDTYELSEIFSKVLSIKPDVVILDYIGLVSINRFWEDGMFTEYSKRVQQFVKESRVGWIDLSNLPIGVEDNQIVSRWQFFGSSYLRNNADVGIHLMKYDDYYKAKEMQESSPAHLERCREDIEYRMEWVGKKAVRVAITKNRIWPAWLEEDYFVNFAQWGRFSAITPAMKLKFSPNK